MTTNTVRLQGAPSGLPGEGACALQGTGGLTDVFADQPESRRSAAAVRGWFESIIAADSAEGRPGAAFDGATLRPQGAGKALSLVAAPPVRGPVAVAEPASAIAPRDASAPTAQERRGAWVYRLQGAAMACAVALGGVAALWFQDVSPLEAVAARSAPASADPSSAFVDAFAQTALDTEVAAPAPVTVAAAPAASEGVDLPDDAPEAEVIARIAAADPPYRVVLHLAPDASPREVARLETAIRAWGFSQPEELPATGPVALSEVAYHLARDREAATILARIADRILAEVFLTPPPEAVAPEAAASDAVASESAGRLDVYVTTR